MQGVTHTLSRDPFEPSLHAVLSQRPDGPLVIGTSELQWLVQPGTSVPVRMKDGAVFRAELIERHGEGTASYVIADALLFAARLS